MTQNGMPAVQSSYADVGGLKLSYQIHGSGAPLFLLHGGVGTAEMFGEVIPLLAADRQVIAVDLQGHGRTADIDRPLSYQTMSDDIATLIQTLGFENADVMGYSLGGGVALHTALRHPEIVRRLVVVSTPFRRSGWYPEVLAGMNQMSAQAAEPMRQTPMYHLYAQIAPRVEDWPVLLEKLGNLLRQDYDWSSEVASLKVPTLIVVGDADSLPVSHAVEFFELLGGSQRDAGWDGSGLSASRLAVLPAMTHYGIFASPTLAAAVKPFLDAPVSSGGQEKHVTELPAQSS